MNRAVRLRDDDDGEGIADDSIPPNNQTSQQPDGTTLHSAALQGSAGPPSRTLVDVLRNALVFISNNNSSSSTSPSSVDAGVEPWKSWPDGVKLCILAFCDGDTLLATTQALGGSVICEEDSLYEVESYEEMFGRPRPIYRFVPQNLDPFRNRSYQAVIASDQTLVNEPELASFVSDLYHQRNVTVVVMAVDGYFDMEPYTRLFGVDWTMIAYTSRGIQMTDLGRRILTEDSFPLLTRSCKASYFEGAGALFGEYIDPADYDDYDEDIPTPSPASPVMCVVQPGGTNKSVACFGLTNSMDVTYSRMVLRLCYAAAFDRRQESDEDAATI